MTRPPSLARSIRGMWRNRPGIIPWLTARPALFLLFLLRLVPAGPAATLARGVGFLVWWMPRRRALGLAHLKRALPELASREREGILKESCRHMGLFGIDSVSLLPRHRGALLARVEFEDGAEETLLAARGLGAVVVQPHLGCFEGMTYILAEMGLKPAVPMRLPTNLYLARRLESARGEWGVRLLPRRGGVRALMSHQKEGRTVFLAPDQNSHKAPVFLPWFGELAATDRTAPGLALRGEGPLLVCWCLRTDQPDRFQVGCRSLLEAGEPREKNSEAEEKLGLLMHSALQDAILSRPGQYLWVHDRYRTRPPAPSPQPSAPIPQES